jgi:site-specific DNA recombinase
VLANRLYPATPCRKGVANTVHTILARNRHRRESRTRAATPGPLKGLIFGPDGKAVAPSHTRRRGRIYRYYICLGASRRGHDTCPVRSIKAHGS